MPDSTPVSGVSGRYATALFELADEAGQLDAVAGHVASLAAALKESADLRDLVHSPLYTREQQGAAMAALCDAMGIDAPTRNMIALMAAKRRLFALADVLRGFEALLAKKRNVISASVVSARPLDDGQRQRLEEMLRGAVGGDIDLDVSVDESLIGGLVVKVGSRMIDTTIRAKLNRLQTAMKEAGI
ncbi:MAG: F0F1 ATP synthase subunit delta [Rhodobacteraceae bacterium]|nr:MAG: F0F1 ATP synthase subunit delta [Paracoccaceae bacterium]